MKINSTLLFVLLMMCFSTLSVKAQISWDFENGDADGFTLKCINPATPADDDPNIAGDEAITGVGGDNGLPAAGIAWTVGQPDMFDGQAPVVDEGSHVVDGVLQYNDSNDPFSAVTDGAEPPYDFTNGRGQSGYLNTYCLNQWGDGVNDAANDQIATSPTILLGSSAALSVWVFGGTNAGWAGTRTAPIPEDDPSMGYTDGSGGLAVISADDGELLDTIKFAAEGGDGNMPVEYDLDLSPFAGMQVYVDIVDAISGGWGFIAVDEVSVDDAELVSTGVSKLRSDANMQNYPNPFNQSTTIKYTLNRNTHAKLAVYDLMGHKVSTLVDGQQGAGNHKIKWDASELAAGVYVYKLETNDFVETGKMNLIK